MRKSIAALFGSVLLLTSAVSAYSAEAPKEWTFLIYINGNNNLDSFGALNIKQMEQVGSTDKINIVVQWASQSARKTVRLLAKKSTNPNNVTSPIIQDLGSADMGDYHT